MKGKFIVLYGINNIGKTVQSRRLVANLKKLGKKTVYLKYPVYSLKPSGPMIDQILRSGKKQRISEEELQIWFVLNRYQFQPTIFKWLKEGKTIVAEDYVGTGIAWGVAKGAKMKTLENMNKFLVQEDLGILMEGKRKMSSKEKGHLHEEQHHLVMRCAKVFRRLAKKHRWKRVKVSMDKDETERRIQEIIARELSL